MTEATPTDVINNNFEAAKTAISNCAPLSLVQTVNGKQDKIDSSHKLSADLLSEGTTNKLVSASEKSAWNSKQNAIPDLDTIRTGATDGANAYTTIQGYGDIVTHDADEFMSSSTVIGNAEIEIQKNGTKVGSFTTNQSGNKKTINIAVPTSASDVSALPSSTKYGSTIDVTLSTSDYKQTITLKDQDGNTLNSKTVDFPVESMVVSGEFDSTNKKIVLTLQNGNTTDIPVGDLISGLQTEITSTNKLDADFIEDTLTTKKLVTTAEKNTWNGKQDALSSTQISNIAKGGTALQPSDVDSALSTTSENPVQNKVITTELNKKIEGISSSDVTTALGYTPYNSSNPSGYQANKIETIKVNGTAQTITSKAVDITVPTNNNQLTNGAGYITSSALTPYALSEDLATVATSGSYNDLSNKPTIPAAQVNADWNATSGKAQILNKPTIPTVPTNVSAFTNDAGYLTEHQSLSGYVPTSRKVAGKALTSDITISASDVGAVPTSRTVNGKALTSNITLSASDVSALPSSTVIPTISDTYSSTSSNGMSGKAVASAISGKANSATSLSGYGITDAYTKTEIDGKLASGMHYKGTKTSYSALPTTGNETGDLWNVSDTGANYAWNGTGWDKLSENIDLSGYVPTSRTINGKALSGNISLTASDVGAISGISSSDVTDALGYTPYNATNPNGYTSNVGTITGIKMNGSSKGTSGVVDLGTVITAHQDISGKQNTITGGATTITSNNLTASRALVSDSNGKVAVSSITSTKLGYLTDVTSNIQAQINGKQASLGYTAENQSNKVTSLSSNSTDTQYPTAKCVHDITKGIQTLQNINTTSGTVALTDSNSMYKLTPSGNTTITFSNSSSASSSIAYTFELCIVMSTVYSLTFPSSVVWQDGEAPDLSATGTYFLAFRTINGGTTWLGNLQGKW